ncbi:MAG: molecular chaperone [Flavobacteriales bacterium]|nr:molecular chaperone [Bacteroidia bacterium]MBN4061860.1 molecular chaperone [Bacteroidales bacterium AH-315-I05]PCJ84938.1 MAG: molecular chaperone [Flavobacteriales bacterium]
MQNFKFIKARIKRNKSKHFFFVFLGLLILFSTEAMAQGNLLIFPKRVVFEGAKRSQTFNLCNIGKDTARYNISYINIRMKEDGGFEKITEPDSGQFFADPYLRFFPRRVVLAPKESQVVKVQLTKTIELITGEYRSHLYFRAIPAIKPLGEKEIQTDTTSISVHIIPVFGISLANIIRRGESTTKLSISNLSFEKFNNTSPIINMEFNRTGNMSVYSDIVVNYISPKGKKTEVGKIQGFAVYAPGVLRKCRIELKKLESIDYSEGKLNVICSIRSNSKNIKRTEAELILQ